ncbi:hypothetical protein [Lachnobacterium bovis]|uniref:AP2/ERF domain-containing protein n=1 Tax=Lachnobacterium bovis TaxID=140626 RepID=A0A1H9Q2D6_9FIRM|nr:hypothetical protein [Lachnobacterium bovis]SER54627.1 hypothetical protein SAMN02910429_00421 [Lachnobacterium bovis]
MLPGVYLSYKKDKTAYYRSSLTYKSKHISLGSFDTENEANMAYQDGFYILHESIPLEEAIHYSKVLTFSKIICLVNFRDNNYYISNPIYLHKGYFSYYLSENEEYKFDIDDLFYYTSHKILKRNGHLFVNDYGMQITMASRYGIHSHAVLNRDYEFINGDIFDYRYSNINVINPYYGVFKKQNYIGQLYEVKLHLNGNHLVGVYHDINHAAIAYNKAIDLAIQYGINKNYKQNYIESLSANEYADIYTTITLSKSFVKFLEKFSTKSLEYL